MFQRLFRADDARPRLAEAQETADRISTEIVSTVPMFALLDAQLAGAVRTTETAALTFLEELQGLDEAAGTLVEEADNMARLSAEQHAEVVQVADISRSTGEVIGQLTEYMSRRDNEIAGLVDDARGLTEFVLTIQKIAKATHMLALNARIEASRAGEHGAGFQVVADEVRNLSQQSDDAARDVGTRIESLAARLAEASRERSAPADDPTTHRRPADNQPGLIDRLEAVAQMQASLVERLETFTGRVETASREMVANSATVHGLTTAAMGGLQFQDITRQVIEHVMSSLEDVGTQFSAAAEVLAGRSHIDTMTDTRASLDSIHSRYVMEEQRLIHAELTGQGSTVSATPAIELF